MILSKEKFKKELGKLFLDLFKIIVAVFLLSFFFQKNNDKYISYFIIIGFGAIIFLVMGLIFIKKGE